MKILRSSSIRRAEAALYLVVFFLILLFSANGISKTVRGESII